MKELPVLKKGEEVKEGQKIGQMGNTGGDYPIHGHLEIAKVDPKITDEEAVIVFNNGSKAIDPREIIGPGLTGDGSDLQIIANKGKSINTSSTTAPPTTNNNENLNLPDNPNSKISIPDQNQTKLSAKVYSAGEKLQQSRIPIVKTLGDIVRFVEKKLK